MMGSHLQLRSTPGLGSTFYFDLTMKSEQGEPIIWEHVDTIKKVLIVDDNDNNRIILEKMLEILKIESAQAKNGQEAVDMILHNDAKYDAVLMDYHMPVLDGMEAIRVLRKTYSMSADELPIVLFNSSADDAAVLKGCEELNVNYRLMKPIKLNDIFLALSRLSQKDKSEEVAFLTDTNEISDRGMLILIAEDNPVNMFLAKTIIRKMAPNAEILEAENGIKAVELCKKQFPDIIFMDVQMPEMNGYEATVAIRDLAGNVRIPIIALTAANVKGEREKCLEAGMDDFISKPFVEEMIWQVFNKYMGLTNPMTKEKETEMLHVASAAKYDLERLKSTYQNDQEFINELLLMTKDGLEKNLIELRKYTNLHDLTGIKAVGHKLKGAASAVFLTQITAIANTLEHLTNFDAIYINTLLSKLENESNDLALFLKEQQI